MPRRATGSGSSAGGSGARRRLGWQLTSAAAADPGFEVNLDATHREAANDSGTEQGLILRGAIRW